jgi:hypothetical protein
VQETPLELTLEGEEEGGLAGARKQYTVDMRTAAEKRYDEQMQKTQVGLRALPGGVRLVTWMDLTGCQTTAVFDRTPY